MQGCGFCFTLVPPRSDLKGIPLSREDGRWTTCLLRVSRSRHHPSVHGVASASSLLEDLRGDQTAEGVGFAQTFGTAFVSTAVAPSLSTAHVSTRPRESATEPTFPTAIHQGATKHFKACFTPPTRAAGRLRTVRSLATQSRELDLLAILSRWEAQKTASFSRAPTAIFTPFALRTERSTREATFLITLCGCCAQVVHRKSPTCRGRLLGLCLTLEPQSPHQCTRARLLAMRPTCGSLLHARRKASVCTRCNGRLLRRD
jgi:hypothetical protein